MFHKNVKKKQQQQQQTQANIWLSSPNKLGKK